MKLYSYWTNDYLTAIAFSHTIGSRVSEKAVKKVLSRPNGPYEFVAAVIDDDETQAVRCEDFLVIAKGLGMQTEIKHPTVPI